MNERSKSILDQLNKHLYYIHKIRITEEEFLNSRLCKEFIVDRIIGYGGFGVVLAATNKNDKVTYAIKIVVNIELKKDEIITLSKLDHPNIVKYNTSWDETLSSFKTEFTPSSSNASSTNNSDGSSAISFRHDKNNEVNNDLAKTASYYMLNTTESSQSEFDSSNKHVGTEDVSEMFDGLKLKIGKVFCTGPVILSFIQQELCDQSLRNIIDDGTLFKEKDRNTSWNIMAQILNGVNFMHSKNIIHRDLNPRNIFLKKFDSGYQAKIGDFGLAKICDEALLTSSKVPFSNIGHTKYVGTSYYIAPEVKNSSTYDEKCDIFSLGIILFEMFYPFSTLMEKDDVLQKLVLKVDQNSIIYPNDLNKHLCEADGEMIDDYLKLMICQNPEDRDNIESLCTAVNNYSSLKEMLYKGECQNISTRFISKAEEYLRMHELGIISLSDEGGHLYNVRSINTIMLKLQMILIRNGLDELPGNLKLSNDEKTPNIYNVIKCEWFGYHVNQYFTAPDNEKSVFAKLEDITNSRTFAWGQEDNSLNLQKYGVVDYVAPKEYAVNIGAEILFLITQLPQCVEGFAKVFSLHIGHIGILKAICTYYECPVQKFQNILESVLLRKKLDLLVPKLKEFFFQCGVSQQEFGKIIDILLPENDFNTFKKKLLYLNKKSSDQTILLNALLEIQEVMENFISRYEKCDIVVKYNPVLSYRCKFYSDGIIYALKYEFGSYKNVVCAGGRYDTFLNSKRLEEATPMPLCAYGINIYTEHLVILKDLFNNWFNSKHYVLIYYLDKCEITAVKIQTTLQKMGMPARMYYGKDVSDKKLLEYCKENNLESLVKIVDIENIIIFFDGKIINGKPEDIEKIFPVKCSNHFLDIRIL